MLLRSFCPSIRAAFTAFSCLAAISFARAENTPPAAASAKIPIIIDTDIGDDFDDCWALVLALKTPRLDVKLITTCYGQSDYRVKILAAYVNALGRTDLPLALGSSIDHGTGDKLRQWTKDVSLPAYQAGIFPNAAQAIVDTINHSPVPITVVALGPMDTLAAALKIDAGIAAKANLVAMTGSVRLGYGQKPGATIEYNVKADIPGAQRVLSAAWKSITIAPLDTAGAVFFDEPRFKKMQASRDPLMVTALSSYRAFIDGFIAQKDRKLLQEYGYPPPEKITFSNPGYDIVGMYLADPQDRDDLGFETLKIKVTDDGYTRIAPDGRSMQVATSWRNRDAFLDRAVKIMTAEAPAKR